MLKTIGVFLVVAGAGGCGWVLARSAGKRIEILYLVNMPERTVDTYEIPETEFYHIIPCKFYLTCHYLVVDVVDFSYIGFPESTEQTSLRGISACSILII